jgi:hypothetical protein
MNGVAIKVASLKGAGERSAEADIVFVNRADRDRDAFGPDSIRDTTCGLFRNHDALLHGDKPPFGIVRVRKRGDRWSASIKFLETDRGREEGATAKALFDAGVRQDVSVGMLVKQTGPVPEALWGQVDRYLTSVDILELSLVPIGAIPGARLTSVKNFPAVTTLVKTTVKTTVTPAPAVVAQLARDFERTVAKNNAILDPWTRARESEFLRDLALFRACAGTTQGVAVPPAKLAAARGVVAWGAGWWGIQPPPVKFVNRRDMPYSDWGGWEGGLDPGTVHLRSDLAGWDLVTVALHERSHVARYRLNLANGEREVNRDTAALLTAYTEAAYTEERERWTLTGN